MSSDLSTALDFDRRGRIIAAALDAFSRFGYARATMADIAAAAGLSRPSLYLVFPGKPAVFRALAQTLLDDAITAAEAAWPPGTPVAAGLAAALLAKDLGIHRLLAATPHAAEILSQTESVVGDLHAAAAARFLALVTGRLAAAGAAAAADTARLLVNAADGLKHARLPEAVYVGDVTRLAALIGNDVARSRGGAARQSL